MTEASGAVTVAWSGIKRQLNANGGDGVYLAVRVAGVKGSPPDLLAVVDAAIAAANDALREGLEESVWAPAAMPSINGPVINFDWVGDDDQNKEWVTTLATHLEGAGRVGSVAAAPGAGAKLLNDLFMIPKVTAFLAHTMTDPWAPNDKIASWLVTPEVTRDLCTHAVEWGHFPGARTVLVERTTRVALDDPDVSDYLVGTLGRFVSSSVFYEDAKNDRYRDISFSGFGQVTYQSFEKERGWQPEFEHVKAALLRAPETLDLAFIRLRIGAGNSWMDLNGVTPPLPYVDESSVRMNRHLWNQYTPDAHPIQVITRSHLDNANDLSAWNVTELPGDRFLLEARDLAPWFDAPSPPDEVLTQARRDFGDMILTVPSIEAAVGGWVPGREFRLSVSRP